ncbi:hypothetical protein [Trinickia soli]|nr:hypothetical protein [Trinickia soli]
MFTLADTGGAGVAAWSFRGDGERRRFFDLTDNDDGLGMTLAGIV